MRFRPDIEGLRALAIIPVLVFHAWPTLLPGGYVGVDVFFVISGYLITTLLLQRLEAGNYSIAAFYAARIRRIFPALFAMLALTLPLAVWLLSPIALLEHARLLGATGLFVSNLELHRTTGYFEGAAELKPLVHTWSLAVEEQYYIVFPLLLAVLHRWRRRAMGPALLGLGLLSLAYSQWLLRHDATLAFYSALARTFELMTGSWLAWRLANAPIALGALPRETLAWLGLTMVLAACMLLHPDSPFPGALALFPALGAALLILTGSDEGSRVARLLSWRPLRWIGSLSFSLYLWHWPALVLTRHLLLDRPNAWQAGVALAASVTLAWASLHWIEAPVRNSRSLGQPRLLLIGLLAIGLALLSAIGVHDLAERRARLIGPATTLLAGARDNNPERARCHQRDRSPISYAQRCVWGVGPQLAVWGDSHGAELAYVMGETAGSQRSVAQLTASGCPPALDYSLPSLDQCATHNRAVLDGLIQDARVDRVLLVARYGLYLHRPDAAKFEAGLASSVAALREAGKQVLLVDPFPEYGYPVPAALAQRLQREAPLNELGQSVARYREQQRDALALLERLGKQPGVSRLRTAEWLCRTDHCDVLQPPLQPLYFDDNHLSLSGARRLRPAVDAWLQRP